jgi:hypothetical protein
MLEPTDPGPESVGLGRSRVTGPALRTAVPLAKLAPLGKTWLMIEPSRPVQTPVVPTEPLVVVVVDVVVVEVVDVVVVLELDDELETTIGMVAVALTPPVAVTVTVTVAIPGVVAE